MCDIRNTSKLSSKVLNLGVERFSRGIRRSIASKISIWMVCMTTWGELGILILKRNSPLVVTPFYAIPERVWLKGDSEKCSPLPSTLNRSPYKAY